MSESKRSGETLNRLGLLEQGKRWALRTCGGKPASYCVTISNLDCFILHIVLIVISSCHFYVYYERTANFRVFGRPFVFLHAVVALLALLPLFAYHFTLSRSLLRLGNAKAAQTVNSYTGANARKEQCEREVEMVEALTSEKSQKSVSRPRIYRRQLSRTEYRTKMFRQLLKEFFNLFFRLNDVNGKLYLYKMFLCKFLELGYQVYSYLDIYRCTFSTLYNIMFLGCVGMDCVINCKAALNINQVISRDRLLMWHVYVDFVCLAAPNFAMYFLYEIPLDVETSLALTVPTTLFIIIRSAEITNDFISIDKIRIQVLGNQSVSHESCSDGSNDPEEHNVPDDLDEEREYCRPSCIVLEPIEPKPNKGKGDHHLSTIKVRRRFSVFRQSYAGEKHQIELEQFKQFGPICRRVFGVAYGTVALGLFAVGLVQLQALHVGYHDACLKEYEMDDPNINLYEYCRIPVDFCSNIVVPSCGCAALTIKNYNHSSLPHSLRKMKNLRLLKIVGGRLAVLPPTLGMDLPALVILHVENNRVAHVPESVCKLSRLLYFYVPQNALVSLPDCLDKLKKMVRLVAFNNKISKIPDSIGKLNSNLLHLLLSRNVLRSIPPSIGGLTFLIDCDLSQNFLTELPLEMGNLNSLLHLVLYQNELESFLDGAGLRNKFLNLRTLLLQNNRLKNAPHTVGYLEHLEVLDVSSNNFETMALPTSISWLRKLKELRAENNSLIRLPANIANMPNLEVISFRGNNMENLPKSVGSLHFLKALYIAGNPICRNIESGKKMPSEFRVLGEKEVRGLCEKQCAPACVNQNVGDNVCDDPKFVSFFRVLDSAFKKELSSSIYGAPNARTSIDGNGCNNKKCKYDGGDCTF